MKKTILEIQEFLEKRNWGQYHTNENLAKSISIEAAELLELFQWNNEVKEERIKEELADVLIYSIIMAQNNNFDIEKIISEKLKKNEAKYPSNLRKGNNDVSKNNLK